MLSHQDRKLLSGRQVAAIYDICNPNQVAVWRRNFDQGGAQAPETSKQRSVDMNPERSRQAPPPMLAADSAQALLEENERLRA